MTKSERIVEKEAYIEKLKSSKAAALAAWAEALAAWAEAWEVRAAEVRLAEKELEQIKNEPE